jgi:anti-anti-sigma factor
MDSMGLGVLVSHRLKAREAGRTLALVAGPPHVQQVFELTGVRDQFEWVEAPS